MLKSCCTISDSIHWKKKSQCVKLHSVIMQRIVRRKIVSDYYHLKRYNTGKSEPTEEIQHHRKEWFYDQEKVWSPLDSLNTPTEQVTAEKLFSEIGTCFELCATALWKTGGYFERKDYLVYLRDLLCLRQYQRAVFLWLQLLLQCHPPDGFENFCHVRSLSESDLNKLLELNYVSMPQLSQAELQDTIAAFYFAKCYQIAKKIWAYHQKKEHIPVPHIRLYSRAFEFPLPPNWDKDCVHAIVYMIFVAQNLQDPDLVYTLFQRLLNDSPDSNSHRRVSPPIQMLSHFTQVKIFVTTILTLAHANRFDKILDSWFIARPYFFFMTKSQIQAIIRTIEPFENSYTKLLIAELDDTLKTLDPVKSQNIYEPWLSDDALTLRGEMTNGDSLYQTMYRLRVGQKTVNSIEQVFLLALESPLLYVNPYGTINTMFQIWTESSEDTSEKIQLWYRWIIEKDYDLTVTTQNCLMCWALARKNPKMAVEFFNDIQVRAGPSSSRHSTFRLLLQALNELKDLDGCLQVIHFIKKNYLDQKFLLAASYCSLKIAMEHKNLEAIEKVVEIVSVHMSDLYLKEIRPFIKEWLESDEMAMTEASINLPDDQQITKYKKSLLSMV